MKKLHGTKLNKFQVKQAVTQNILVHHVKR